MTYRTSGSLILLSALSALIASGCAGHRSHMARDNSVVEQSRTEHRRVLFDFNKTEIRAQDRPTLDDVAQTLQADKKSMAIVEGHADQIGGRQYNEILSENRARAVRVYLRDQGADPRRMTITSKGSREPLVTGRGREQLQANRRVEVTVTLTKEAK